MAPTIDAKEDSQTYPTYIQHFPSVPKARQPKQTSRTYGPVKPGLDLREISISISPELTPPSLVCAHHDCTSIRVMLGRPPTTSLCTCYLRLRSPLLFTKISSTGRTRVLHPKPHLGRSLTSSVFPQHLGPSDKSTILSAVDHFPAAPARVRSFTTNPNLSLNLSDNSSTIANMDAYKFPDYRLKKKMEDPSKTPLLLVACGSFSPITFLHLRMFVMVADYVRFNTNFELIGGYLSPVSDAYKKQGLALAEHRYVAWSEVCEMD